MSLLHQQNIKLVIFDLDGTIADTSEGILDSHKYTLEYFGKSIPSDEQLRGIIGGNLLSTYINTFGFSEDQARRAIKVYRSRYADVGIHKAQLYSGFKEMLITLKKHSIKTAVATLKSEKFAKIMLNDLEVGTYFDVIYGMDDNDELDKPSLVKKAMKFCNCSNGETVLIGDSYNDWTIGLVLWK